MGSKRESDWEVLELPSTKRQPPPLPVCLGEDATQWLRKRKVMRDIAKLAEKDGGEMAEAFVMSMSAQHSIKILVVYSFMIIACAIVVNVGLSITGVTFRSSRHEFTLPSRSSVQLPRTQNMFVLNGRRISFARGDNSKLGSKGRLGRRTRRSRPRGFKSNISEHGSSRSPSASGTATPQYPVYYLRKPYVTRNNFSKCGHGGRGSPSPTKDSNEESTRQHYNARHNMSLIVPLGAWELERAVPHNYQARVASTKFGAKKSSLGGHDININISAASAVIVSMVVAEVDSALYKMADSDLGLAQQLLLENRTYEKSPNYNLSLAIPFRSAIFSRGGDVPGPTCPREIDSVKYVPYRAFSSRWLPDVRRLASSSRLMKTAAKHTNTAILGRKARECQSKSRKADVDVRNKRREVRILRRSIRELKRKVETILFRGFVRRNRGRLRAENPYMSRKKLYAELATAWEALPGYERDPTAFIESRLRSLRKSLRVAESKTKAAELRAKHLAQHAMQASNQASDAAQLHV